MSTSPSSLKLAEALAGQAYREYPYDVYAQLREHPGWKAPSGYRVFSTYDDVLQILRQPAVFGQESVPYPNFHTVDPPEHTRLRRLVAKAFTVQSVNLLRDRIAEIVAGLVADVQERGEADLISDFSLKLSATVTAELLRVPVSDAQMWNKWLWEIGRYRGVTSYFSIAQTDPGAVAAAEAASGHAAAYMRELVGTHRHIAEGGIVKRLLEAREEDETLSEKEVLYTLVLLLGAGLHTTASQLGNFFRALLTTRTPTRRCVPTPIWPATPSRNRCDSTVLCRPSTGLQGRSSRSTASPWNPTSTSSSSMALLITIRRYLRTPTYSTFIVRTRGST